MKTWILFCSLFCTLHCLRLQSDAIVDVARQNMLKAKEDAIPVKNPIKWDAFISKIGKNIMEFSNVLEAIQYAQHNGQIGFDHRTPLPIDILRYEQESLKEEFPHFQQSINQICESSYSMFCSDYNGRLISNILHYHYRYLLQCLTYVSTPSIVCQIGGGYGDVERLWLTNSIFNPDVCIIIDFPESLFFAEVFLKKNFENDSSVDIIYFEDEINLKSLQMKKKTVILCPIGKENMLNFPIDLVINTGSLQEMTDSWVDYWMQWLDKSDVKYFYSLNYGANPINTRAYEVMGATTWAPRLSTKWNCLLNSSKPFLIYSDAKHLNSGFAEILAIKDGKLSGKQELMTVFNDCWANRKNDSQGFLECLDVVRRLPEQEVIWELLQRIFKDMSFIPRETYYLLKMLKSNSDEDFLLQHRQRIQEIEEFISISFKDLATPV